MRHIETILERIPDGRAGRELVDGCLVLEGGAFRGLYTGGVVDALMQNGINIKTVVGVSAGALYGLCYTAGRIGWPSPPGRSWPTIWSLKRISPPASSPRR